MIQAIEKMLLDFERGHLSRRQFAVSLVALATTARASRALSVPQPTGFLAVSLNHVTVRVPDLHRTSQFYQEFFGMPLKQHSSTVHILGVGDSFFGIEQGESRTATVDHYDFGIAHFNADDIRAKLQERGLKVLDPKAQESFKFLDPDGFQVQVNAPDYVGHVS
jgi:catechol 2,3-dioxygenase-like lactoylglutathione lyase family enzyme